MITYIITIKAQAESQSDMNFVLDYLQEALFNFTSGTQAPVSIELKSVEEL